MKKTLVKYSVVLIAGITILLLAPALISQLQNSGITADIHKINPSSAPYLYEYKAATFNLYSGEKSNLPTFKITQAKRSLDFTVRIDENPDNVRSSNLKPKSLGLLLPVIKRVQASENVKVINEDTAPAIEYKNVNESLNFVLAPNQDKVQLSWNMEAEQDFPSLEFQSEKLVPKQEGESIIFYTRNLKKAFELKSVSLADNNDKKYEVNLELNKTSGTNYTYNINFNINNEIQFPANLNVDIVSLFHERMIGATPVQSDFASFEKPQFYLNTTDTPEPLKTALINRDYTNVKFGVIDSNGRGRRVPAELVDSNGKLTIRFTGGDEFIKPGLYDLLVQYKDEPSFIGEEEFSWGVLAMNPDQAVYRPGQKAKIDMAVLDHLGRVVCDADLKLEITDPAGKQISLSTENGLISVSNECKKKETDLPDYTTTYQTGTEGKYAIILTATTTNGTFTIKDSFSADASSPFYVKKSGPTRIFPPKTYEMRLIIEANRAAGKIVENVPDNFTIEESPDFTLSAKGTQTITWKKDLQSGQTVDLSYRFKGPNISPALFFVGPVQIGPSESSGQVWQEPRVWQIAFDAIETLRPNATGTYQEWDLVDTTHDGATSDQNNATYIETGVGEERDIQNLDNTTFPASDTINSITVYITCKAPGGSGAKEKAATLIREGGTDTEGASSNVDRNNFVDISTTYATNPRTAAAWQKSEIDALEAGARLKVIGGGETVQCSEIRVDVDHVAAGPTNAQLLRHGTWFDAGVEQPMTF